MDWHRFFGLFLTDFFADSPFEVEIEHDLSLKQQLLDVVVIRRGEGTFDRRLPDGLEELSDHNLVTFKSHQTQLSSWALNELLGHYVNYRKQVSNSPKEWDLLPEAQFRLFAVSGRFPRALHRDYPLTEILPGVYQVQWGDQTIRIIVAGELNEEQHNAMIHLFSVNQQRLQYAVEEYRQFSPQSSTLIQQLLQQLGREGITLPYTMEDFLRESKEKLIKELTPEERQRIVQELPPEEILKQVSHQDLLKGMSLEEIREYLRQLDESGEEPDSEAGAS